MMKRAAIGAAVCIGVIFLALVTGIIRVGMWTGPGGFTDGKDHQVVEITMLNEIGYSFGNPHTGWFRPMQSNLELGGRSF
jgi:hypothetical protein